MARPTNTTGFNYKGIYRTPLTTGGQTLVNSSGCTIDNYGKFITEIGSSMQLNGMITSTTNAKVKLVGVTYTSNTNEIPNSGFHIIHSTEDIKMRVAAPVTGSWVKLITIPSTKIALDNCAIKFIVTTNAGRKGRICGSSGRMVTMSTNATGKKGSKAIELVGTTKFYGVALWVIAGTYGPSSQNSPADALGNLTVSSATD
ncbi:MAG: hypothetical protein H7831_06795 [Magnetococcus sp. WYHC-3]